MADIWIELISYPQIIYSANFNCDYSQLNGKWMNLKFPLSGPFSTGGKSLDLQHSLIVFERIWEFEGPAIVVHLIGKFLSESEGANKRTIACKLEWIGTMGHGEYICTIIRSGFKSLWMATLS